MQTEVVELVKHSQGLTLGWLQFTLGVVGLMGSNLIACFGMVKWMVNSVEKRHEADNSRVHKRIDELKSDQKIRCGEHMKVQTELVDKLGRIQESSMQSDAALLGKFNEMQKQFIITQERSKSIGEVLEMIKDGTIKVGGKR